MPNVRPGPASNGAIRGPAMTDVASLAGVSHQTVSRVINKHPNVTPTTRTRVLAAIEELGYHRNNAARRIALRGQSFGDGGGFGALAEPVGIAAYVFAPKSGAFRGQGLGDDVI